MLLFVWNKFCCYCLGFCIWYYRNNALVAASFLEVYYSVYQSKEGIVFANTDIVSGVVLCAALANDNVAGDNLLATPNLNA